MFIHGQNIYIHIYYANKRPPATFIYPEFCLPPKPVQSSSRAKGKAKNPARGQNWNGKSG
jgi:hypothetical protein